MAHTLVRILGSLRFQSDEHAQFMLDAGWLDHVLQHMDEQQGNSEYQIACCVALMRLYGQLPGKTAVVADTRTVPYVRRARDKYPDVADLRSSASILLEWIATGFPASKARNY